MTDNNPYLLTDAAHIMGCSIEELVDACLSFGLEIGVIADCDWYFWESKHGGTYPPIQNIGFVALNEASHLDVPEIINCGYKKVDFFYNGYLTANPKFKYGGVVVKKHHLAISKSTFIELTEPSNNDNIKNQQLEFVTTERDSPIQVKGKQSTDDASSLSELERNTLLKLVLGMAIDAYGYDPNATKNTATGSKNGISASLELHGISINDDTVRKYLTEAKKILWPPAQYYQQTKPNG